MIPKASDFFTESERQRIDEAVTRAEKTTSGEIVPVLAGASGNYDRGLFLASIGGAALATLMVVGIYLLPLSFLVHEPWAIPLYTLLPAQILGLVMGYQAAVQSSTVHKGFVPYRLMQTNVHNAAVQAFGSLELRKTKGATGILIYVSLFERMVVVLADKAINSKLTQETWDQLKEGLVQRFRAGQPADGFKDAIERCGAILTPHFPIAPDDVDELPNHLRVID